jgi:uncharacterized protein (DUF4213/DUF364 family)
VLEALLLSNKVLRDVLLAVLEERLGRWRDLRLREAGLAPHFSYVVLENGAVGMAYNPGDRCALCLEEGFEASIEGLLELAWRGPVETSLALAAFSAVTQSWIDEDRGAVCMPAPPLSHYAPREGGEALMVGYMRGMAEELVSLGYGVVVLEDDARLLEEARARGLEAYPGSYMYVFRPRLLVATGASMLDPRLHAYMASLRDTWSILVGPTATMHPEAAFRLGFHCVGGSYVSPENRGKILRLLKLGAGYHLLWRRGLVEKWVKCRLQLSDECL